jgi:hypothetical protein
MRERGAPAEGAIRHGDMPISGALRVRSFHASCGRDDARYGKRNGQVAGTTDRRGRGTSRRIQLLSRVAENRARLPTLVFAYMNVEVNQPDKISSKFDQRKAPALTALNASNLI